VEVKHAGGIDLFDRVVMATHSDTARKLRGGDITIAEAAVLDAIPYSYSKVYLHTGMSVHFASCTDGSIAVHEQSAWVCSV
jgi:predicted NAD/FAD-binding protein